MQFELREKNSSKKYYTGSVWENKFGQIKVLGQTCTQLSNGAFNFVVEFENGFKKEVSSGLIKKGNISNPYVKTVCNIGFLGEGLAIACTKRHRTREYNLWHGMITRCYNENMRYTNMSYKDCTVNPEWFNFQTFAKDIKSLKDYDRWKANVEEMQLDKDIKIKGNKIYSKESCIFVTKLENTAEMMSRNIRKYTNNKKCLAIRISDGYKEEFYAYKDLAEKYNLSRNRISECVAGKRKSHKGWVSKILDD